MTSTAKSHSQLLGERMQIPCGYLFATFHRFWRHPELGGLLPAFLILMHQIVRASMPLMNVARSLAVERANVDEVCRDLAGYLAVHIEEERHHDDWVLEDLEAIGKSRRDVIGQVPSANVAALVGAQYYWIQHHHPVALLGYIRLLEGNPPSDAHIRGLQQRSGLPDAFFRTYRLHGDLDPNHVQQLDLFLDSLPLSEWQGQLIWISSSHTASALAACLEEIERESRLKA